jgi:hypothetical protein
MKLSEVKQNSQTDNANGELKFNFNELLLEDLKDYTEDIKIDGDKQIIVFEIY